MKKLLTAFFVLLAFISKAQQITYAPMSQAGYVFKYQKSDSGNAMPFRNLSIGRGTNRPGPVVINIADTGFYYYNGVQFIRLDGKVDSVTSSGNNVCQWKAGVPTCYLINGGGSTFTGVDSLTYIGNSLCWWKQGIPTCYSMIPGIDSITLHDSTLCQWKGGISTCYTIHGNILGSFVDSVTVIGTQLCQWKAGVSTCYTINTTSPGGVDSLTVTDTTFCEWIGGVSTCFNRLDTVDVLDDLYVIDRDANNRQAIGHYHADGLVGGGIVTKHSCWSVDITSTEFYKNFKHYTVAQDTALVVDTSDVTFDRQDLVVVDTLGNYIIIKGTPSVTPVTPQYNLGSEVVLATIYIPANSSCLGIITKMIYNENVGTGGGEFQTGSTGTITVNFNNTDNPYNGAKAAYVSKYADGGTMTFTDNVTDSVITGMVLKAAVYLNQSIFSFSNWFQLQFFNAGVAVSDRLSLNTGYGLNPGLVNQYQIVTIPLSVFNFSGGKYFDEIKISMAGVDTSGAGGFYLDWLQLQYGLQPINKSFVDSTKIISGIEYYYKNGIAYPAGSVGGSGGIASIFNIGSGFRLVVPTDSVKTLFNGYAIGIDSSSNTHGITFKLDTTLALTKLGAAAIYLQNITGLVTQGSNVTVTGSGTAVSPYVINSSAPGTGTVTSISQGYGIVNTPNPIVSTGTVAADSATLSLTYLRRKDSTLYTTIYQNSLKLNITDTTNKWVNNVTKNSTFDSIYVYKGTTHTALKDSVGNNSLPNFVDTLYRTAGKDSIQFTIKGRYHAIKDSSGGSGGLSLTRQVITSGTTATVTGGNYVVTFDPSATIATFTLTMPASPSDLQTVEIGFGGTLTSGAVVTSLTISPNSGQTIQDNTPPGSATADNTLYYRYYTSKTAWQRIKL